MMMMRTDLSVCVPHLIVDFFICVQKKNCHPHMQLDLAVATMPILVQWLLSIVVQKLLIIFQ